MPRWLRFSLIGCGGLIGIIVLIGACSAIISQNAPSPPAAPEKEEAKEEEAPAKPDEPAPPAKKDSGTVTVRVTGTPGTAFSGSYGTPDSTRTVDGVTPQEFEVEVEGGLFSMDIVTAVIQKQSQGSEELTVEIVSGGQVVKEQSTTATAGVVSITANPTELRG